MKAGFLAGGGAVGKQMRAKNWADTPLGPVEHWPQSLKTVVRILLNSRYQMWMLWGPQSTMLYNEAYAATLGIKRVWALGQPAPEVWKEVWAEVVGRIDGVLAGGEATWDEGLLLFLERSGYPEETYHTFSYSSLADDDGRIVGMLCVVTEETERIIGERRLNYLGTLAAQIAGCNSRDALLRALDRELYKNRKDLPFALTYLFDETGNAHLAASGGSANSSIAPSLIAAGDVGASWPVSKIKDCGALLSISDLKDRFADVPTGAWDRAAREAIIAPIARQGQDAPAGFFVAGINPYRRMDEAYLDFIKLVAGQIASGLANAQAHEAAERRADARLRSVFETSFTYQGVLALDGTLLDTNGTSLLDIGLPLNEVINRPFWDTPWFSETAGMSETVRAAIPLVAKGQTIRQEMHLDLPVGGWRWFDFLMRPMRDSTGTIVAIVAEAVEFTERRRAEETLRQSQKMEGIGQLTGGIAHDFNNLLTIIVGSLETLRRQMKLPTLQNELIERSVESAMRGAQRAASLTQRLLAFSRQQPLDPKPVEVNRLVSGMSDLLRRSIGESIAIETVLSGGLWRTNIDANQLEMAIINLAVNARDAMPNGGKLTIETANAQLDERYAANQSEVVPGQYVMLAITDSGTGMTSTTLAKAFEPFFTTKDVGHGTGLGLSQVYGFVKQSGGHIKIYSEPGDGTTVKIYLPRLYSEDGAAEEESLAQVTPGQDSETILAVEDDADVRAHTVGILRELGYRVMEAATGSAALDTLHGHPEIDLLFTDVGMPGGMNGRQLADAARLLRPKLKVLFTTGYARNAIVHDGRLDPGVQLLTKPFTFAGLSEKVRDLLDTRLAAIKILIVEDEPLIQMLLSDQLEGLGYSVELAASAAEARNKMVLHKGQIDAAIIDMGLPDAKGDRLVSELRAMYPRLPVVISSGYDRETLQSHFAGEQGIEFLSKPFTAMQLQASLQALGILN